MKLYRIECTCFHKDWVSSFVFFYPNCKLKEKHAFTFSEIFVFPSYLIIVKAAHICKHLPRNQAGRWCGHFQKVPLKMPFWFQNYFVCHHSGLVESRKVCFQLNMEVGYLQTLANWRPSNFMNFFLFLNPVFQTIPIQTNVIHSIQTPNILCFILTTIYIQSAITNIVIAAKIS